MTGRPSAGGTDAGLGASRNRALFVVLLAAAALMVLKSPDAWLAPQFWAEDGAVFFAQQYDRAAPQLWLVHAGYLHLLPRLAAWIASFGPAAFAPVWYAAFAFAISTFAVAWSASRVDAPLGVAIIVGVFLTPTNGEVFGTLTNVQWFTQIALAVLAFRASNVGTSAYRSAFVAAMTGAIALTGPFSILVALTHAGAMFASRIVPERLRPAGSPGFTPCIHLPLYVGAAIQAALSTSSEFAPGLEPMAAVRALASMGLHVFGDELGRSGGLWLSALLVGWLLVSTWWCRARSDAWILLALVLVSLGQIAFAGDKAVADPPTLMAGDRYYVLLRVAFACSVFAVGHRLSGRLAGGLAVGFGAAAIVALMNPTSLQRPALTASDWASVAEERLRSPCLVELPIQPTGWSATIRSRSDNCAITAQVRPRQLAGMHDVRSTAITITGNASLGAIYPSARNLPPRHLAPRRYWGTWKTGDSDTGRVVFVTPRLCGNVGLPFITGPSTGGISVEAIATSADGKVQRIPNPALEPAPGGWSMLLISAPDAHCATYRIEIEDNGSDWGQWVAAGLPRANQLEAWSASFRTTRHEADIPD